jgi:Spy/CpxP family protein refolding chaperone
MKSFRTVLLVAASVIVGCSSPESPNTGAASNAVTTTPAKEDHEKHPRAHVGGPELLIFAALHEPINLTAEQRSTIEGLVHRPKPEGGRPAPDKAKTAELASAIRAGTIDAAKLHADHQPNLLKEHTAALAAKIATLHQTLTRDQRAALVDAVAAKHQHHRAVAHHELPLRGEGHLGHLLDGLDVTQAQRDQIHAKLEAERPAPPTEADIAAMKKEHEAKLQSFKDETFDANAFVAPPAQLRASSLADRMAKDLQIVVSVLTPEQREKLAQKIEQHP